MLTADHLVVIGKGRLIADGSVRDFIGRSSTNHVRVVTPQAEALRHLVEASGVSVTEEGAETL